MLQHITENVRLAVWHITEDECFFLQKAQLKQKINHPHKRLQHLAGRYLLSLLFPLFPQDEILISSSRKPYLPSAQYHFSVSHCGDYAAAIISSEKKVGIDIEKYSSKTERVKHKYLKEEELVYLNTLAATDPHLSKDYRLFTLCWSAKEAVYKWWGEGEIDFKKNINISRIDLTCREISVTFTKQNTDEKLTLYFVWLADVSMVWVIT